MTDVALPETPSGSVLQRAAPLFDIPSENLTTIQEREDTLRSAGFARITVEDLTEEVIAGFASSWRRAWKANRSRPDGSWLRYRITAAACRYVHRSGALRYVMLQATKA